VAAPEPVAHPKPESKAEQKPEPKPRTPERHKDPKPQKTENQPAERVVGMGEHVPAFMMAPVKKPRK